MYCWLNLWDQSEIWIKLTWFSFKKLHMKILSAKCDPFCSGLGCIWKLPLIFSVKLLRIKPQAVPLLSRLDRTSAQDQVSAEFAIFIWKQVISDPSLNLHHLHTFCAPMETLQMSQKGNLQMNDTYHQTANIRCTKSQNLNVSHLVLQLSLPNPLKAGVKSRMKM